MIETDGLTDADYRMLADFRHALRAFTHFSELAAEREGLTPQQHQALLAIRAASGGGLTIGALAERLILRHHSVSGLVDRLVRLGLVTRIATTEDRRRVRLALTAEAERLLAALSAIHRDELQRLRPSLTALLAGL